VSTRGGPMRGEAARSRPRAAALALLPFLAMGFLPSRGARAAADDPCAGAAPALQSAEGALDGGEWAEAEERLASLEASHPGCGEVALDLARLRAAQGRDAEAEPLFERATSLGPDDARTHALFAQYWLSRGQPARADYQSSLALSLDPGCPEALLVAAAISGMKGRPREAGEALAKAARLAPSSAEAQYQWGVWLFRVKRQAEAIEQFEKAAALHPADARILDYLALGYEATGEARRADKAFERALRVNEEGPFFDSNLEYNYGRFLLKERRLEEARTHLDRAAVLLPYSRGVHYERGKLSLALGDYERARREAELALSLRDPSGLVLDLQVYYLLATVYTRLGETDLARKYAELARTTPIPDQD
jgi:tetratricopeptide (TPR) repeat protein